MDRILYKEANGDITCRSRDFDKIFPTLYAYEELEMTPEDIEKTLLNFSSFLMEMTGGRMSKTNYTVQAMVSEANDYFESCCDECSDRKYLAEIEKELEKLKAERDKPQVTFADQVRRMDDEALAWQFASLFAGGMGGVMEGMGMKFNVEELLTMAYPRMMAELKGPAKEG